MEFKNSEFAILVHGHLMNFSSKVTRKLQPPPNNFAVQFSHFNFERTKLTAYHVFVITM